MSDSSSPAAELNSETWVYRLFRPAHPWVIPYSRFWKISLRTLHLMVISVLLGGHVFGAPAEQLRPLLYGAILTGAGMIVLETYPSPHFIFEGWGLFLLAKLALLCIVPFAWNYRVPLLLAVVALAGVGSHLPGKVRHYSLLYRKVIKPKKEE